MTSSNIRKIQGKLEIKNNLSIFIIILILKTRYTFANDYIGGRGRIQAISYGLLQIKAQTSLA